MDRKLDRTERSPDPQARSRGRAPASADTDPAEVRRNRRPAVALTFDDLPAHGPLPPGETRLGIARRIIAALRQHGVPAPHGFVNGGQVAADPQSSAVLDAWTREGYPVGNHTWSHPDLEQVTTSRFLADTVRNESVLRSAAGGTGWRWFRYPFLSEGRDAEKRDAVRAALGARGYRIAAVTMGFGDYAWNDAFHRCSLRGDARQIAILESSFLEAARVDALRARAMSRAAVGRDISHVLLLHLGAFDARMMPRLLALYEGLGFRFVSLETAQADPFYRAANKPSLPGPSPRLDAAALPANAGLPSMPALPGPEVCAAS